MSNLFMVFAVFIAGAIGSRVAYGIGRRRGHQDIIERLEGIEKDVAESMMASIMKPFDDTLTAARDEMAKWSEWGEKNDSDS